MQDKLELALREKKVEHEKAELDTDAFEAQKQEKLSEQKESAAFNLRESNSMLRDASAALKKESKTKREVEQVSAETLTLALTLTLTLAPTLPLASALA